MQRLLRRFVLALVGAFVALVGPVSISATLASGVYASPSAADVNAFKACALGLQGARSHRLSMLEATRCGPHLAVIDRSAIATTRPLPTLFIVKDGSNAALEGTTIATRTDGIGVAYACSNTWSYPNPTWWAGVDWGGLNATGYGNHCNYANMTGETQGAGCIPGCNISITQGTADSVWNLAHYNINSALGWGNIQFSGSVGDFWACRAFVDTNGNQNPGSYCS